MSKSDLVVDVEIKKYIPKLQLFSLLANLPTRRLLAFYKKYRGYRHIGKCDCCSEILYERDKVVNALANQYLDTVKEMLDAREHVV